MGLSSNTLIQQTSFDNLKKILSSEAFRVSYCYEEFTYSGGQIYKHVFPMVCFSEIAINSLHNHLFRYGDCIIGMKKKWAMDNKLNQVHYYQKNSNLTKSLFKT